VSLADTLRERFAGQARKDPDHATEDSVAVSLRARQGTPSQRDAAIAAARDTIRAGNGPHEVRDTTGRTVGTVAPSELHGGQLMVEIGHGRHALAAVLEAIPGATVHTTGSRSE